MSPCTSTAGFDDFMQHRQSVSNAYIRGDARGLSEILTGRDPATFMSPGGGVVEGAAAARRAQLDGSATFGPGSRGHVEILQARESGDLAFWTGRQVATMDVRGQEQPVQMVLRTTEVFRRENGRWKLVHRHADIPHTPEGRS